MDRTSGKSQPRRFRQVQNVINCLRPHLWIWLSPAVCYLIILFFSVVGIPSLFAAPVADFDKALHFFQFLVLGILAGKAVLRERHFERVPFRAKVVVVVVALILSAIGELLQFLNSERSPELFDYFSNVAGFGTGLLYWQGLRAIRRKHFPR